MNFGVNMKNLYGFATLVENKILNSIANKQLVDGGVVSIDYDKNEIILYIIPITTIKKLSFNTIISKHDVKFR